MDDFNEWLRNALYGRKSNQGRKMKRVFQWRRYIEWKNLSDQEKLTAKRILLIPVLAFPILVMIRVYTPIIITGLLVWFLYRKFEKGGLRKK
tara:strand:+ start:327 stop:602 length:276 start_codon:yes stop_codon:yes gene_type:complete